MGTTPPKVPTPAEALHDCEVALRQLIRSQLAVRGPSWFERCVPEGHRRKAQIALQEARAKKGRKGELPPTDPDLLDYVPYEAYMETMEPEWSLFARALGKLARARELLGALGDYRNDIAHSRPLLPFQELLVAGISGLIRNQVTIFMSEKNAADEYYPRVESARDSFGNATTDLLLTNQAGIPIQAANVLRPGDEVTFEVVAVDPQGRDLEYSFTALQRGGFTPILSQGASGERVRITWHVTKDNAFVHNEAVIRVSAIGAEYHRQGDVDATIVFAYTVLPPLRAE